MKASLIVLILGSVNPFDWRQCDNYVIYCTCYYFMQVVNFSSENGCPLSEKNFLAVPYCVKSCWNLDMVVSADFLGISKRKGYSLKVLQIKR